MPTLIRDLVLCLVLPVLLLTVQGRCDDSPLQWQRYTFTQVHMGTEFKLTFYAPSDELARMAAEAAFARVAELDLIMSDYKATSELMRLCHKAGGEPVKVSEELFSILEKAQEFSRRSEGAFDVTVGPVVRLWRKARRTRQLPEPQERKEALARVGFGKIKLDPQQRTVQLLVAGMLLDLGGIAKGFAADAVLAVLRRFGIRQALLAAGGDIVAGDAPPARQGWKVGVAPLKNPEAKPQHFLLLVNSAVSTSGDVEQHVQIDGQRYSHIVDPKTGLGLLGRSSVTVIAPNGTTSDALATAVSVLGPQRGLALIEKTEGTACLILRENEKGELQMHRSRYFEKYQYPEKE